MAEPTLTVNGLAGQEERVPITAELGVTGLKRSSGYVQEEFLRQLAGPKAVKTYREMAANDPVVGAVLLAIELLIRSTSWSVTPASDLNEDQQRAEFLRSVLFEDMSITWEDTLVEILSFLTFGYSWHECVYKIRGGDVVDPARRSKYNDNLVGLRKLPIRAQESLAEWKFSDEDGDVEAMVQSAAPDYRPRIIPLSKSLLFRTKIHKGNPEGVSLLRPAYVPWYRKTHLENFEGIGIERGLAGIPIAWVPLQILNTNSPDPQATSTREQMKKLVTNLRRDEQEGILMPLVYDNGGNKLYDLTLLSTSGNRPVDTDPIVRRYDQRIAMSVLGQFLLLGSEKVGSYSLSADQTDLFTVAINAWTAEIAAVFNQHFVPKLFRLNQFPTSDLPKLTPGRVRKVDLVQLSDTVQKLAGVGYPLIEDPAKVKWIDEQIGWPHQEEGAV